MQNFQNTFETLKQSFFSAFSICMTVPLNKKAWNICLLFIYEGIILMIAAVWEAIVSK